MRQGMETRKPSVGLVAMPWYSVWVPSVQLSVLRQCLHEVADVTSYELYVDYAATISTSLYDPLSGGGEFVEEWLFAQHYFRAEGIPYPDDVESFEFPPLGVAGYERENEILRVLAEVTGDFLIKMRDAYDWGRHDVLGFTLGIAQTSASIALAALIRRKFPHVRIMFGGSACAGPQAEAIMAMCPYVDVIVRGEAEGVVGPLVRCLASGEPIDGMPGLTVRGHDGTIRDTGERSGLYAFDGNRVPPNFDEYLARMRRYGLRDDTKIMLPFESSRGCWWGEKSQCTFCGLADDMRYRSRDADAVLAEIDALYERYGLAQFFATDLIMPQRYYRTFLPKIRQSARNYRFYYELKGNVAREDVSLLAGLVHVQPGLESLNSDVLAVMKKGITAAQNVQFLKWCAEYGVLIFSWHLIVGMPGERAEDNTRIAGIVPSLYHLPAPLFAFFELHRFSPIYRDPANFGLSNLRPARGYRRVFPVAESILEKLVYRFEYDSVSFDGGTPPWMITETADAYAGDLRLAIDRWHAANARTARFSIELTSDGAVLRDSRASETAAVYELNPAETRLYDFIDTVRARRHVAQRFKDEHPAACAALGAVDGVETLLRRWEHLGWTFNESGSVIALAVHAQPRPVARQVEPLVLSTV